MFTEMKERVPMNRAGMEIQAIVNGVSQRELLDFFDAFEQVTGYMIESPFVNQDYLDKKGHNIVVAVRALLSQKLSKDELDCVIQIFEDVAGLTQE